jgi:hypothetical protein
MTRVLTAIIYFLFITNLNAKIIYLEPMRDAKFVSINNNIIIGFDEMILSSDLNSIIQVKGAHSGIHTGSVLLTEDRKKLLFKPHHSFAFNEIVEVSLKNVKTYFRSDNSISFTFRTQVSKRVTDSGDSYMYATGISDLKLPDNDNPSTLPVLTVNISNNPSPGDLYLSNFPFAAIPNTPYLLIADNAGVYSYTFELSAAAFDFKKHDNGLITYGTNGIFYVQDFMHNLIDSIVCGNGYGTDLHDIFLIDNGHSLLLGGDPRIIDMSLIVPGGQPNALVLGLVIQELDENKIVIFQWRSLDHIAITDAVHEDLTSHFIDYVHVNAIELDNDGNILISSRHLSEITKINRTTGDIIWRLGGAGNQFNFVNDTIGFSYQHDIRRISNGNITLFDNGNYHSPQFSRAVEYSLDEQNKIATMVWQYRKTPDVYSAAMGSSQRLKNGNTLISWGSRNPQLQKLHLQGISLWK